MTEKQIEKKLLTLLGQTLPAARTIKLNAVTSPRGWPDQLVVLPGGRCAFVEFKRPGGVSTKLQHRVIAELSLLGHRVLVGDDPHGLLSDVVRSLS